MYGVCLCIYDVIPHLLFNTGMAVCDQMTVTLSFSFCSPFFNSSSFRACEFFTWLLCSHLKAVSTMYWHCHNFLNSCTVMDSNRPSGRFEIQMCLCICQRLNIYKKDTMHASLWIILLTIQICEVQNSFNEKNCHKPVFAQCASLQCLHPSRYSFHI